MHGHIIVCGDDALAMRIIDELNNAELSVVTLQSPEGLQAAGIAMADAIICVADDDAVNLEMALLARQASPRVRVVARLVNTVLREAVAAGRPYALAFVDVRMPPGWDGVETITRFRKVDPDLQTVICTAYSDYSWNDIQRRLGHSDSLLVKAGSGVATPA